jgi:Mn-dependent DtxR family transcriptional regulator
MPKKPNRTDLKCSKSAKDHLAGIQSLIQEKGYSRVTDLAKSLHLSASSVSNMVRRLAQRGFVNYERYRGFTLTAAGKQVAQQVSVRREALTEFLELLGLNRDVVSNEVEEIEHHLKPETLRVISQLVSFWRTDPARLEEFNRFLGRPRGRHGGSIRRRVNAGSPDGLGIRSE